MLITSIKKKAKAIVVKLRINYKYIIIFILSFIFKIDYARISSDEENCDELQENNKIVSHQDFATVLNRKLTLKLKKCKAPKVSRGYSAKRLRTDDISPPPAKDMGVGFRFQYYDIINIFLRFVELTYIFEENQAQVLGRGCLLPPPPVITETNHYHVLSSADVDFCPDKN
ncbi:unnamed protein product [Rotaria socialis]